jgi:uncharacterized protein
MSKSTFWTPEEVDFLDHFLSRDDAPEHVMDVTMLDGYLTAVVSGPNLIMPSDMLRWVWDTEHGQEGAHFKDQAEAEKVIGLVMEQWNAIAQTLSQTPAQYAPQLPDWMLEDGSRVPILGDWCSGYYKGMSIDMRAWAPLLLGQPALLSTVLLYGTEDGLDALVRLNHDAAALRAAGEGLADMVRQVHAHWLVQRTQQEASGQVPKPIRYATEPSHPMRRDGPKLGRNDPCHCGSGRKYKHCHGAD